MSAIAPTAPPPRGPLDRFLRIFAEVHDGEGGQVLLLAFNVFLILTAYYVMKPVREALILAQPGGAEIKSYSLAAQAVLLAIVCARLWRARDPAPSSATHQRRHRLLHRVPAALLPCRRSGPAGRRPVLPLDRHLQPDGDRAVLGICERSLYARRRKAALRARRLRCVIGRGVRRIHLGPPDRCARCARDAAHRSGQSSRRA